MNDRLIVRDGHLLTMDPDLGELPRADLLVDAGRIAAVGPDLPAGGAEVIDAAGCIVVPGFVDAHRHLWQTFLRGMLPDATLETYMRDLLGRVAPHVTPEDGYVGNLLGALECLNAGITTVYDWSHALAGPEDSDARIAGLLDAGIRGYFAPSTPASAEWFSWESPRPHPDDVRRLRATTFTDPGGLLRLGAALRSPGQVPDPVLVEDWAMAREAGALISIHAGARHAGDPIHEVLTLERLGLLGSDVNLAHGNELTDEELDLVRTSGASIATSLYAEMTGGHGRSSTARFLAHGITPALSADAVAVAPGDMFSQMRAVFAGARAEQQPDDPAAPYRPSVRARDVLGLATSAGARALLLDDVCGSLTVGKAADVVLVRGDDIGTAPVVDAVATVVNSADTSNVDTVLVGGRVVKRHGRLVGHDVAALVARAARARDRVLAAAGT